MPSVIASFILVWAAVSPNATAQGVLVDPKTVGRDFTTHSPSVLVQPDSLEDLVKKSDVVAHGIITAVKMEARRDDDSNQLPTIQTVYSVRILEAPKVSHGIDNDLSLVIIGGSLKNGQLLPLESERQFRPGEKVLLFLKWWDAASAFLTTGGIRGMYDMNASRPKALRQFSSPLRNQVEGRNGVALLDEIRRLALK